MTFRRHPAINVYFFYPNTGPAQQVFEWGGGGGGLKDKLVTLFRHGKSFSNDIKKKIKD